MSTPADKEALIAQYQEQLKELSGRENRNLRQKINRKLRGLLDDGKAQDTQKESSADATSPAQEDLSASMSKLNLSSPDDKAKVTRPKRKPRQNQRSKQQNQQRKVDSRDFIKKERVGKGSFAECYRAVNKHTNEEACMKVIDLCVKKCDVPDVRDELKYLNRIRHRHCLRLFAYNVNIELVVTMIVELCPYSLEDIRVACDNKKESIRTRLGLESSRRMYWQVIQGVKYLHNFSKKEVIAHLDLKADNVMSTKDGVLKIADFGLAQTLLGKDDLVTDGLYRGTEEFMAPEVNGSQTDYGIPADIWSLGMMFYELIFGALINPTRESYDRRLQQAFDMSGLNDDPEKSNLLSFFSGCFEKSPSDRLTIEDLEAHGLFKKYNLGVSKKEVVTEIAVVEKLKREKSKADSIYQKLGALPDLDLDSSSEESSSDEDSESDSDEESEDSEVDDDEEVDGEEEEEEEEDGDQDAKVAEITDETDV